METPDASGHVFNIGNTQEISMMDLAKQVREAAGSRSEIVLVPYEKAYEDGFEDMPRRIPALAKMKSFVGWEPTIQLPQIISDVIEFYRKRS
jgi:UDP-glucose 4-epimerase